ncbi:DBH-like monooxygenase 1, partial [Brachionus plicatilis]
KLRNEDLNIIAANPHTHLSGLEVSTKIIRDGQDIGYLFRNKYYDFNYQNTYLLNPPVQITKKDELITECIYQTSKRTNFTFGGLGTRQEMCYHFLTYYPRQSTFKRCLSVPSGESYFNLMQELNKTENLNLPAFDSNSFFSTLVKMYQLLENKPISTSLRETYKNFYKSTRVSQACDDFSQEQHDPINISNAYVEPDPCKETSQNDSKISTVVNYIISFFKSIFKFFGGLF